MKYSYLLLLLLTGCGFVDWLETDEGTKALVSAGSQAVEGLSTGGPIGGLIAGGTAILALFGAYFTRQAIAKRKGST